MRGPFEDEMAFYVMNPDKFDCQELEYLSGWRWSMAAGILFCYVCFKNQATWSTLLEEAIFGRYPKAAGVYFVLCWDNLSCEVALKYNKNGLD